MTLRLHNTLTGRVEPFEPAPPAVVRLYTCGPTVHDRSHVGNFRTFVFEDVLRRYLELAGYQVRHVMNLTDVDDRILKKSRDAGLSIAAFTAPYIDLFFADAAALDLLPAHVYPKATEYVTQMQALVERLVESGHAYERDGSVYFRIASFPAYGRLAGVDLSGMREGARVDVDEYDKDDPRDFVLWKAAKEGEASWESPWGPGRPGWHLECSAMAMTLLGESLDIHCGGVDNIFPHHENEIAQSEAATGRPFARFWLHAAHLTVGDEKMAKRVGNFVTVGDLVAAGHDPLAVRYLLLAGHYRSPVQLGEESLGHAAAALDRLRSLGVRLLEASEGDGHVPAAPESDATRARALVAETEAAVRGAMDDDLNTPRALAALFGFVREANARLERGISPEDAATLLEGFRRWDKIFGVLGPLEESVPSEVAGLVAERERARAGRDFAASDRLRAELRELGWLVEDTPAGARLRKVGAPT